MITKPIALGLIAATVVAVAAGHALARSKATVEELGPLAKKVNVEGREYLVLRLGNGHYTVTAVDQPLTTVTFTPNVEGIAHQTGSSTRLEQLKKDLPQFPEDLFK